MDATPNLHSQAELGTRADLYAEMLIELPRESPSCVLCTIGSIRKRETSISPDAKARRRGYTQCDNLGHL